jgi:hypothetical protein
MNHDDEPDPVARLRAADPAGNVEPRAGFADELVARTTGPDAEATGESASAADIAAQGTRRPRWQAIAAVAASVLLVGAAGYGLGATAGMKNIAGAGSPPASLQTGESSENRTDGAREPGVGAGAADQTITDSIYPSGVGRNSFSASGLSSTVGTAAAYAFDPNAGSIPEKLAPLAAALGVTSPAELREAGWSAGPQDGSAPNLTVSLDGMLSFYYQNPLINPWLCSDGAEACQPVGEAPSEEAAIGTLRSLLSASGRNPALFEFTSHRWEGSPTRTAEARPVIDGHRIDQAWSAEVAEAGVVSANGAVADVIGLGGYPVVSEQEGFERLSNPRFGGSMTLLPAAGRESADAPDEWVPPTEPPATPQVGASLPWPVHEVRIVSSRLGLASQWQPDGSVLVLPAYEFTDSDGGVWSVVAVDDSRLDFSSE